MSVNVNAPKDLPKGAMVIEAFPSRGYVSTLAANQLIKKLEMDMVGHIECDKLDAIAVVHDGQPLHPIRIYHKDNLIVIFSELMIPFNLVHEFTAAIGDWFKELQPESAILLASVPGVSTEKEHEIMNVSTDEGMKKKLKKMKVKGMDEGVLTGMSSSLMIKCCAHDIPATSLMVETSYIPDVLAAASLLEIIGGLLDMEIDVDELMEAGHEIEKKFKETLKQIHQGQENYHEIHQLQSMYR
ncbi:MAG: hypothetical protein GF416_03160 [Candidatus Altiarchaeales archaeon]|nr:hypothetical protein [Candidatus Altiarchaeales archaeon]MBD3416119.1 hypothetical protein [Candidatus Altiarchaeales archaeon]